MSKFDPWWVRWDNGVYISRMTLGGRVPTSYDEVVHWFKSRGFDRVVFIGNQRACDYYKAISEINPSAFSTGAYYFDVDFKVIDTVRGKCPDW